MNEMMNDDPIAVLLVEDDPEDARVILEALAGSSARPFVVEWVMNLSDALAQLSKSEFEVVLLDLTLPDGKGLEAFNRMLKAAPNALILVLSSASDEDVVREAMLSGASDYLAKGHIDAYWLPRALLYVIERKMTRDALHGSEIRFRAMSDASPLGIFVSDAAGACVYTNLAYQEISGLSLEQTLGTKWSTAVHLEDRDRVLAEWHDAVQDDEAFQSEARFVRKDGSLVWTRLNAGVIHDGGDRSRGRVQIVEDITERRAAEQALRVAEQALFEEKEHAEVTLKSIGDGVVTTDLQGRVTYLNPVAEAMTGWSRAAAQGLPLSQVFTVIDGKTRQRTASPAEQAISEDRTVELAANAILVRRDGFESAIEDSAAPIHDRAGRVSGAVIVFHDVSKSQAMAHKMIHLAQHDFLTGLPNRALLTERLTRAIGQAERHRKQVALLYLDLDFFKHINDSLGHAVGDRLLQSVARRLEACVRTTDTVCRQGGDEFVILLAEIADAQDAAHVVDKLLLALTESHQIDEHELHVSLSIGISVYPDDGTDADVVMQNADTAMYHAKENGRDNYQFFHADMNARAVRRMLIESSLRRALKQDEFLLHYQPQVDLASGAMTGVEALLRWQDPELGVVYPQQFISIAEDCGLIVPIGRWVLREACRQVRAWQLAGLAAVPVAVNVSAVEFRHKDFLAGVELILAETGLAPGYLEFELTEGILMHDAESSVSVLQALKVMGVQLAIDDFGTGYSSLSYLRRFPIDTLKIDQSFVHDIGAQPDQSTIVSAVIGMGINLRQRVIAEGVETHEQLAFLRTRLCDEGQGFLFSHPLPPEDIVPWFDCGGESAPMATLASLSPALHGAD